MFRAFSGSPRCFPGGLFDRFDSFITWCPAGTLVEFFSLTVKFRPINHAFSGSPRCFQGGLFDRFDSFITWCPAGTLVEFFSHAARVEAQKLRSNPKLTLYRTLGAPMRRFWLDRAVDHPGIHLRFRLRCAGAPLMDNVGENCGVPPICRMCSSGATEDAQHFACHCDFYADLRQECLTKMRQRVAHVRAPKLREAIESGDVHLFLGDRALVELPADV